MSDAAITPVTGGQFTLKTLVAVRVSSYTVNIYPVVKETMEVHERAHAYHVNKLHSPLKQSPSGFSSTL
jgi:hypothetical protein